MGAIRRKLCIPHTLHTLGQPQRACWEGSGSLYCVSCTSKTAGVMGRAPLWESCPQGPSALSSVRFICPSLSASLCLSTMTWSHCPRKQEKGRESLARQGVCTCGTWFLVSSLILSATKVPGTGSSMTQGRGCPCHSALRQPSPLSPQYYCCKKSRAEDADEEEEEEHELPTPPGGPPCNACSSQARDGRGSLAPLSSEPCGQPCGVAARHCAACSPYSSPFYIRTADMVPNGGGGERLSFAPSHYKEGGPLSLQLAAPQSYPVTWPGSGREAFTNPRAISTDV